MLTKTQLKELKSTSDQDLLKRFPGYTRQVLRQLKNNEHTNPKILILDIETAPIEAYVWGVWDQRVSMEQVKKDWFIICWSGKWLNGHIMSDRLTSAEMLKSNDKRLLRGLYDLLDEADIVVAHNGDKFDIKKINARFAYHGMGYPSMYKSIDTLKICKKEFSLTFNKLDYICRYFNLPGKMSTGGQDLWNRCKAGDEKALEKMDKYCKNDVIILERVFKRLTPYIRSNAKNWDTKKDVIWQ